MTEPGCADMRLGECISWGVLARLNVFMVSVQYANAIKMHGGAE